MATRDDPRPTRTKREAGWRRWAPAGLLALIAGGLWWLGGRVEAGYTGATRPVARGPLRISVSEGGAIEPREKVVLRCEVDERSTTITYIVPEGTRVTEGDLLVELDASVLQDELYDEEIDLLDTEALYLAAKEDLAVAENKVKADLSRAELALRFAREDVKQYVEGGYPRQLMAATNNVKLAEEKLKQAQDNHEWSQQLFDRGFLSASELDRDALSFQSAQLEVELARTDVAFLEDHAHKRQLAQLESDVQQAELALERVQRKTEAELAQAQTNLRARERQLERQQIQLEDIQRQVANCTIRAPVAGMVVYASTGRASGGDEEPIEVGREVHEQEELIHIPTADAKSARVKVHESALDKVKPGQDVLVTVDAMPERAYHARVARISPLPDAQVQWMNPDLKVYDTELHLIGDVEGLRTGMSCRAEILVEEYEDALYVPVHSVVRIAGQPTVFVVEGGRLVRRPVEVGLHNNHMVRVISGLEEGEEIALAPPLEDAAATKRPAPSPTGPVERGSRGSPDSPGTSGESVEAADARDATQGKT